MIPAMAPLRVDLTTYRGDTWTQEFRFLKGGEPVDLTGATLESSCRSQLGESYPMPVTVIGDPSEGVITLGIADWDEVPPGDHSYDIEATSGDGTVTTWVRGRMRVLRDVTNELPLHEYEHGPYATR